MTEEELIRKIERSNRDVQRLNAHLMRVCPRPDDPKESNEDNCPVSHPKPKPAVCHEPLAARQGTKEGAPRIAVRIKSFRSRLLDPDNLCVKSILDGLRYAKLIPDDRPQDITLSVSQEKCRKDDERTEIEIEPENLPH